MFTGSGLPWPPLRPVSLRAGSGLVAYASESATGCGYEIAFALYALGVPSPNLDMPGLGQGFKGYKILISVTLYPIVWTRLFHPFGETWNLTQLSRNTNLGDQLGHFNWEP